MENLNGKKSNKFPTLTEPYVGYDNIIYAEEFGKF